MRATTWAKLLRNAFGQYLATGVSVLTGLACNSPTSPNASSFHSRIRRPFASSSTGANSST